MSAISPEQKLLIGGVWVAATENRTFEKPGPTNGAPVSKAAAASAEDAARAASAADAAFRHWANTTAAERAAVLDNAARLLEERKGEIAETMTAECGATSSWSKFNCCLAAEMLRHAASIADKVDDEVAVASAVPGLSGRAVRQPAGVVVGIAPWNAPVILATRAVATPMAFGNTVVLKASEECPRTHGAVARAIADAGVPFGVINLISNAPRDAARVVDALIAHPAVRRINFTGSTKVGRIIAAKAAEHLKPTLLELGGKAPIVVLADADLDQAAAAANFGAFMNSGQICMSTDRVVVDRLVAAEFEALLCERAGRLIAGDPRDPQTMIGPVINTAAAQRIRDLIDDAKAKGGRVLTGGDGDGPVLAPTILAGVTPDMRAYSEEIFGPVVTVIAVDGPDEAVAVANDTDYGLAAAIFGRNVDNATRVALRLQTGICHINGATVHDEPQVPFGGVKASGWGRFGGDAAVHEFTDLRWITVQEGRRVYPI